ncbi:uncharacterized protein YALI1_D16959g [Yarrowia lipolytica]|uniref:Uncharacterized protein n=1 Tax=Yarrowia lipolytica TaxID=4952 RepID=A0A1D8NEH0_YARLL|nr:hypothetical protein YALI1_D16959g [Yarrowia lipolytica]
MARLRLRYKYVHDFYIIGSCFTEIAAQLPPTPVSLSPLCSRWSSAAALINCLNASSFRLQQSRVGVAFFSAS